MNKKGFTLVEIIVALAIITLISGTTIVVLSKKNNNTGDIDKKIVDATSVYIETEKDENGNLYIDGINNGGKGLQLTVSNLYEKGYLSKEIVTTLENKKGNINKLYILVSNSINSNDSKLCKTNLQEYTLSWNNSNKPIYLCPVNQNVETKKVNISTLSELFSNEYTDKIPMSNTEYDNIVAVNSDYKNYITKDENGIFVYTNMISHKTYFFYRGVVDNNYVYLGEYNGKPLKWRIIWQRNDGKMKLALDDSVPITVTTSDNETITLPPETTIYKIKNIYDSNNNYIFTAKNIIEDNKTYSSTKLITYIPDKYFQNIPNFYNLDTYNDILKSWYENTNLDIYEFITSENNFCLNNNYITTEVGYGSITHASDGDYYKYNGYNNTFVISSNFDCCSNDDCTEYGNIYSSKIGYITYGDAYMAGLYTNKNSTISDNIYQINNNIINDNYLAKGIPYILGDSVYENHKCQLNSKSKYSDSQGCLNDNGDKTFSRYYISEKGITTGTFYNVYSAGYDYPSGRWSTELINIIDYKHYNEYNTETYITKSINHANIKPAIIIDTNNYKLSNNAGTESDPYEIVSK